jgi:outer membrane protein assembly factor BamB
MVYVGSYDNKVYCLNATTGAHIWNYTTGGSISESSPAVADGKVFIGSYDNKVYCLNASTGAKIWSYTTGALVKSSPAIADNRLYIGSDDNRIYAFGELQDITITSVTVYKTVVGEGYPLYMNVTVENEGVYKETFNVTVYANKTTISTLADVTLPSGSFATVIFIWNTTGMIKGNYVIFANVTPVQGEINTDDNIYRDGWVVITTPGDIDCDGRVFLYDLTIVGTAWDSRPGDSHWYANADIDGDQHVFLYDLTIVGSNWD